MRDRVAERRSKVVERRASETHAVAFIPVAEWWDGIPLYPGSIAARDNISVTEPFDGSVEWLESMSFTSSDPVEAVTCWYLTEMQCRGWRLLEDESRVEQKGAPDYRWLEFVDRPGQLRATIHASELGRYPPAPAKAPPEFRKLHDLFRGKMREVEWQAAQRTGQTATYITLSWSQKRSVPAADKATDG